MCDIIIQLRRFKKFTDHKLTHRHPCGNGKWHRPRIGLAV